MSEMNSSNKPAKDSKKYTMAKWGMLMSAFTVLVLGGVTVYAPSESAAQLGVWGGAAFVCIGGIVSTYCYGQSKVDEAHAPKRQPTIQ